MLARIGVFERLDHEGRDWVIDAVRDVEGMHGVFHVLDEGSGRWLSISFFEDDQALSDAVQAIGAKREELGIAPAGPDREERYEVVRGFWKEKS